MHFATREWTTCFVCLSWSSCFFMRAAASDMWASNSCCVSIFFNLCSSSNPTNKNLKELGLGVQTVHFDKRSKLDTCPREHFYHSARYYNTLFPNINFSSWIALYNSSIKLIRFFEHSRTSYFHTGEMLFTLKVKSKLAELFFTKILSPPRNYTWHFYTEFHTNWSVITESMGRIPLCPLVKYDLHGSDFHENHACWLMTSIQFSYRITCRPQEPCSLR
jgi:hypothetical protein